MPVFFTPLIRTVVAADFVGPRKIGSVVLQAITDCDLRDYLGIVNRVFVPDQGQLSCTYSTLGLRRLAGLNRLQELDVNGATYALVSGLPLEEHQRAVACTVRCLRLLRVSQVAVPVTLNSDSPGSNYTGPLECKLGGALVLDNRLIKESVEILPNLALVPDSDMCLIDLVNELGYHPLAIVLLVTLLERILMTGDKNEISFKVAFYGSRLLGNEGYSVGEVFDDLRRAYDLRSKYVHSGEEGFSDFEPFLNRLYKYATTIRVLSARSPELVSSETKRKMATGGSQETPPKPG